MRPLFSLIALLLLSFLPAKAAEPTLSIFLTNNQPFAVRMPIEIRNAASNPTSWLDAEGNRPAQTDGSNLCLIADIPAGANQHP